MALATFALALNLAVAPAGMPDTEIYLYPLMADAHGLHLGAGRNISRHPGYDNQPSFADDDKSLLFTSARDGDQTDIYRYRLDNDAIERLTNTPESEFSPHFNRNESAITTVRVEADGTQRLWQFPLAGGEPELLVPDAKPVGYYLETAPKHYLAFILGEPPTLQAISADGKPAERITDHIGRCLQTTPDGGASFVRFEGEKPVLYRLNDQRQPERIVVLADGGDGDFAWAPDGKSVLSSAGGKLYRVDIASGRRQAIVVPGLPANQAITRIAVSHGGAWLALVAAPAEPKS